MSGSGSTDVAILGGGVIGLSIAYVLASEGVACTVLERGELGKEASWAGAGIISPGSEKPSRLPTTQMRTLSARLHEQWAASLREETGIDNGYRVTGGMDVALNDHEAADLASMAGRWREEGISHERMVPSEFPRVEPSLGPEVCLAFFLPDRAQIRNPRHLRALQIAVRNRGAILREGEAVDGFETRHSRVLSVRTNSRKLICNQIVVAAGAWTGPLLKPLNVSLSTPPVRGQIVLFGPGPARIRRIIEHGTSYLVPRDDGRILAGSTEEDAGFDRSTTETGIDGLLRFARRVCPILQDAPIERTWAGLRPGSLDRRPTIGSLPGWDNVVVATGHQRAGLQLSPATAMLVADVIQGRTPRIDLGPFRVDRKPGEVTADAFRS